MNQRLVQRMLEKEGHDVVVVGNGLEALEALKQQAFDLVLMDVQMPLMDGIEATKAIREAEALTKAHIPIIALTAHAMKGDQDRCHCRWHGRISFQADPRGRFAQYGADLCQKGVRGPWLPV